MRLSKLAVTNIVLIAVAGIGGGLAYANVGAPKASAGKTVARNATVSYGTVMTTVSASGNVTAPNDISVAFGTSGKITEIDVTAGQQVKQGQVLARVDATAAKANLDAAQAALASAQAKLSELEQGATALVKEGYDLSNQQAKNQVVQAQAAVDDANAAVGTDDANQATAIAIAYQQWQNDITNGEDDSSSLATAVSQALNALSTDGATLSADELKLTKSVLPSAADLATATNKLDTDTTMLSNCKADPTSCTAAQVIAAQEAVDADQLLVNSDEKVIGDAAKVAQDRNTYSNALNAQQAGADRDQQTTDKDHQNYLNAQQTQTATHTKDEQAIKSAEQALTNAQLSQQVTANSNAQKTAAPLSSDVATDQAAIEQAQASVDTAQQTLDATSLTAPADGTVGTINDTVGQSVSAGTTTSVSTSSGSSGSSGSSSSSSAGSSSSSGFLTLTNLTGLQVVANIDEADAAKVVVGAPATVTLNALPGKEFGAHVIQVADTSTVSSNVVEYQVTFAMDQSDTTVKPGMTANVSVITSKVDGVLNVTSAAVRSSGGTSYVLLVQPNGTQKQVDVVVGLKGDTTTQIEGALKSGDTVALPATTVTRSTSGATTPTGRGGGFGGFGGGGGGVFVGGGGGRG